jgi:GTP-binding protein
MTRRTHDERTSAARERRTRRSAPTADERLPRERTPAATVAIVGRPNVGKSTLFNRLIRKRKAITLDTPGVTRDPIAEEVVWQGQRIRLVDTGGLGGEADIQLADCVHEHTVRSVAGADLIVVLFDTRAGVSPLDRDTVDLVSKLGVPALYVANKTDGVAQDDALVQFCELGIDVPLGVSAEHDIGLGDVREAIVAAVEQARGPAAAGGPMQSDDRDESHEEARPCRVAIVGRPNVGKSSLLNAVAGRQLALVDATPGTTRDVVDLLIERDGREYLLIDTAGIRRPSRVDRGIERLSVGRSMDAIERSDVAVLLVEPSEGVTDQDARIAHLAWDEGRALVIVMNKVDLLDLASSDVSLEDVRAETRRRYPTLAVVPMGFMSVAQGRGVSECFRMVDRAHAAHNTHVQTADLNRILAEALERKEPPVISGGRLRLFYAAQTATRPPTFTIFVNRETVPRAYTRFLERCFREALPLEGTPVRLRYRKRASHGARDEA